MNPYQEILRRERQSCYIHASRIQQSLAEIHTILPLTAEKLTNMSTYELAITELLTGRFAKLQDAMGEKIFPLILLNLGEDIQGKSFIDRLHMLEKLGYMDNAQYWFVYRKARNAAAHEYPDNPEMMVKNLKDIIGLAEELVIYWNYLDKKIETILMDNN